jgi:hypothetical protein
MFDIGSSMNAAKRFDSGDGEFSRSDQRTLQSQCSVRYENVNVVAILKWRGAP